MDIKIIKTEGKNAVVEAFLDGTYVRRIIPLNKIIGGVVVLADEFEKGIAYGLPFDEFIRPAEDFANKIDAAFHNAGIWTLEDLRQKSQEGMRALQSVYGLELARIAKAADIYLKQVPNETSTTAKTRTPRKEK